jgi:beta-galactosidase GanA
VKITASPGWVDTSAVGIDGYCEYMEPSSDVEVIGRFESNEPVLHGRPAATRRKLGKGTAIQLAFWPKDDSVLHLFRDLVPAGGNPLASPVPGGVQAVPRADGSLFVLNTTPRSAEIRLSRTVSDRLATRKLEGSVPLKPFEVLWLE